MVTGSNIVTLLLLISLFYKPIFFSTCLLKSSNQLTYLISAQSVSKEVNILGSEVESVTLNLSLI